MELKTAENPIDTVGPAKQVIVNLFYGWGFNFYRKENQLRADDLLVRSKVSAFLGEARAHLAVIEAEFRRVNLPPPSREHPFPNRGAVETAQALERSQKEIEVFETRIRTAAVPEMDRIHQRHREEKGTLEKLLGVDINLVEAALEFKDNVLALSEPAAIEREVSRLLQGGLMGAWKSRESVLSIL